MVRGQCRTSNTSRTAGSRIAATLLGYLLILYEMEQQQVTAVLGEIAGKRKIEVQDVLIRLGKTLPKFSQRLLDDLA